MLLLSTSAIVRFLFNLFLDSLLVFFTILVHCFSFSLMLETHKYNSAVTCSTLPATYAKNSLFFQALEHISKLAAELQKPIRSNERRRQKSQAPPSFRRLVEGISCTTFVNQSDVLSLRFSGFGIADSEM